ncbi:MAG: hypothetical protein K0R93_1601 [Anaerosolibacter sp.]|uniref:hypothetical protein n=1 Tax=Anaerosolibacter sp. TaxID=1872527 RepID=UPI002622FF87|nr:hypothetical protein [Anaerosolibacter sp.]MDF2546703.1 hypothetical protein [Anaerosolibacter sp.]
MQKNSVMKKIIVGAMIGTMVLTMTAVGFADDTTTETVKEKGKLFRTEMKGKLGFRGQVGVGAFEKLVETGVVAQEKADAMKTYMESQVQERKAAFEEMKNMTDEARKAAFEAKKEERIDRYDQMARVGVISEEESTKIKAYLEENKSFGPRSRAKGPGFETALTKLVEEGKLKEDSSKAIQEYMKAQAEERKAEMEKIKNLSAEEKKAYFEASKKERIDIFEKMVEDGVISADEAKTIKESMPQRKISK